MDAVERGMIAVLFVVLSGAVALLQAIPVMLGSGVLHGYWPVIPAFTFWQSVALTWAWAVVWTTMGRNIEVSR